MWILPRNDSRYSTRWGLIKEEFTRDFVAAGGEEVPVSNSRRKHRERSVWQRRFWEHTVEDNDDLRRCVDYIHWNPVKHGYVRRPADWTWSSFLSFVRAGDYPPNWGEGSPVSDVVGAEWD